MNDKQTQSGAPTDEMAHPHKFVHVTVDKKDHEVRPGRRLVSEFKHEVGVPPEKALEQVVHGQLTPLNDTDTIDIKGGEVFVSHARQGGSS